MPVPTKGAVLERHYQVERILREDQLFSWTAASDIRTGERVYVQVLKPLVTPEQQSALIRYFQSLQNAAISRVLAPEIVLSGKQYPLLLLYSRWPMETLLEQLPAPRDTALKRWRELAETVYALQSRRIVHGRIVPECLSWDGTAPSLTGFGWAPLLAAGQAQNVRMDDRLAPEIRAGGEPAPESDLYGLAMAMAQWAPSVRETSWYLTATHQRPELRFSNARQLFEAFAETLERPDYLPVSTPPAAPEPLFEPGLTPKFSVKGHAVPAEGGAVEGEGTFPLGATVTLKANPAEGWQFTGWTGALIGLDSVAGFRVKTPVETSAHFQRLPSPAKKWRVLVVLAVGALVMIFLMRVHARHGQPAASDLIPTESKTPGGKPRPASASSGSAIGMSGRLRATSEQPIATLYIRPVAGGAERAEDCSPSTPLIPLAPGRYRVRVSSPPSRVITAEKTIEIKPGKTITIGPDASGR